MSAFGFYCSCGGAATGAVKPESHIAKLEAVFRGVHSGPGHAPTTQAKAADVRRVLERNGR